MRCARKWVGRYRREGESGLRDRPSAPQRLWNRTPADRVQAIVALRRLRMTAAEIAELLTMPLSTVSAVLKRQGMGRLGRIGLEQPVRYERTRPGELVPLDVKKLGRIEGGAGKRVTGGITRNPSRRRVDGDGVERKVIGWEYVHIVIDDYSRFAYAVPLFDASPRRLPISSRHFGASMSSRRGRPCNTLHRQVVRASRDSSFQSSVETYDSAIEKFSDRCRRIFVLFPEFCRCSDCRRCYTTSCRMFAPIRSRYIRRCTSRRCKLESRSTPGAPSSSRASQARRERRRSNLGDVAETYPGVLVTSAPIEPVTDDEPVFLHNVESRSRGHSTGYAFHGLNRPHL